MLEERTTIRHSRRFGDELRARATRESRTQADMARLILAEGLGLTADSIPAALPASEPSETPVGDHLSDQDEQSAQKKNVPPTGEDTGRVEAPHPGRDADATSRSEGITRSGPTGLVAPGGGCGQQVLLEGAMGPLAFACELPAMHEGVCEVRGLVAGDSAASIVRRAQCAGAGSWEGDLCGRLMLGSGPDSYDPVCELAEGHDGACMSTAAIDQHKLLGPICRQCGVGLYVSKSPGGTETWSCGRVVGK